jgi:hypothetical protein
MDRKSHLLLKVRLENWGLENFNLSDERSGVFSTKGGESLGGWELKTREG